MRSMFSDHQMADLAGNGFAVTASMVIDIAIFLSIKPVETDTNDVASSDPCSYLRAMIGSPPKKTGEQHEQQESAGSDFEFEL